MNQSNEKMLNPKQRWTVLSPIYEYVEIEAVGFLPNPLYPVLARGKRRDGRPDDLFVYTRGGHYIDGQPSALDLISLYEPRSASGPRLGEALGGLAESESLGLSRWEGEGGCDGKRQGPSCRFDGDHAWEEQALFMSRAFYCRRCGAKQES